MRAVLALWCVVCVCGAGVGGSCGGVCCVHARACVRCVCGAFGCLSSPFWAWFGGSSWVWGLCVVAPLPSRLCGSPPFLAGVCWWCVPPPPPLRALPRLSLFRVAPGGVPLVPCPGLPGCGGCSGGLVVGSGPFPRCFPFRGPMLALPVKVELCCTGRPFVPARYKWTCSGARYSSRSPHRGRVHSGSQGSPCGTGVSLACPDGRCALPAVPPWARTAIRAVGSAHGQAHWSPPQAGATAGR